MVKLLGCMCIFGSGIYLCRIQVLEVRRELDTLSTLTAALEQMAQEIRLTRTPLPRLMESLGRKRIGDTAAFFQTTASSLGKGLRTTGLEGTSPVPLRESMTSPSQQKSDLNQCGTQTR